MNREIIKEILEQSGIMFKVKINPDENGIDGIDLHNLIEIVVKRCGYLADVFEAIGAPDDMDATTAKHSDYINRYFGVK
jgi:hypothetical protein